VLRSRDANGRFAGDLLTLVDDQQPGEPLLEPVMRAGRRLGASPGLDRIRDFAREQLEHLPAPLRGLEPATPYRVEVSPALEALADAVDRRTSAR